MYALYNLPRLQTDVFNNNPRKFPQASTIKKKNIINITHETPGKRLERQPCLQPGKYGGVLCHEAELGFVPEHRATASWNWSQSSLLFSRKKPFLTWTSKPELALPVNYACVLPVRRSVRSWSPSPSAQCRWCHLSRRNWGESARDTRSWKGPKVIPVFWRFSYATDGDGCLPQLPHPLWRLKINTKSNTGGMFPPVSCVIKWPLRAKKKKKRQSES